MAPKPAKNSRYRPCRRIVAAAVLAAGVLFGKAHAVVAAPDNSARKAGNPQAANRLGKSIRVHLPITGRTLDRVRQFVRRAIAKAEEETARLTLIFELNVPEGQDDYGRGSQFGAAYDLPDFLSGEELSGVQTVAYVPQSIQGHAVLIVLACDQIIMGADARLGLAGVDEKVITESRRGNYREIARRRKTIPADVALWMLDPTLEVWMVETEVSREYVTPAGLAELHKRHAIKSKRKLFDAADPEASVLAEAGQFTGEEGRRLNFVAYLASDRSDVAEALELPREVMDEDLSLVRDWKPVRVNLKGPIDAKTASVAQDLINDAIQTEEANFIVLWIDSQGGSPADSIVLAGFLAGLDSSKVRTVAYIPERARSDAALVALACHQTVMRPDAELGGAPYRLSKNDIHYAVESIKDKDGPWKSRSWSLIAAMIDPDLAVFRCTRRGKVGYFCDEELQELGDLKPMWRKGEQVTRGGEPLLLEGARALEYGLASHTLDNFAQFIQYYDLPHDPALLEPDWVNILVEALASPGVAAALLTIAFIALYAELSAPGIGVGGFVATVCFLLFFWSHYLDGTVEWLEVLLFLAGVGCLLLEIFVLPGFGIFGLGGGLLVLASLILASQTFVVPQNAYEFAQLQRSLLTVAGAAVGIVTVGWLSRKWLPHAPIINRMLLQPPAGEEAETIKRRETLVDLEGFVGKRGAATTQLTPSGKARFGDMLVDVITDGDVVERGAEIEVVEVHGNRVIVRKA